MSHDRGCFVCFRDKCDYDECKRRDCPKKKDSVLVVVRAPLSFAHLRQQGTARSRRWHGPKGVKDWNSMEWAGATCGEAGEMLHEAISLLVAAMAARSAGQAANIAKKIKRVDSKLARRKSERSRAKLVKALGKEIADTIIYLDHLAAREGILLDEVIKETFNSTSKKFGFPERL